MINNLIVVLAVALSALVSGCASMADAMSKAGGVGVIEEEKSTFDNAMRIKDDAILVIRKEVRLVASTDLTWCAMDGIFT